MPLEAWAGTMASEPKGFSPGQRSAAERQRETERQREHRETERETERDRERMTERETEQHRGRQAEHINERLRSFSS